MFFIRRSFKDNAIYKWVLQSYLDYLVSNVFSIEFYIEGAGPARASCSPRFGLCLPRRLLETGKSEDLYPIPTSIAYDQIQDVDSYAAEQRGAEKEAEPRVGAGCDAPAPATVRRHLHPFGEAVSVAKELSRRESATEGDIDLQKLAFEVMVRINRVTPITAASLVTTTLLALQTVPPRSARSSPSSTSWSPR